MPRDLILGTAGHIDHGKTSLVKALTGIDCDRLPEEKARGITIDIGFATLELPSPSGRGAGGEGYRLGIVDVPGHERFVKNMLAGATGIDLVVLIIAADDSIMPQTREHLEILKLLGIRHGVIAMTKCDLVDETTQEVVELEIRDLVQGSFLDNAPIIRTSAHTGRGIEELKTAIAATCDSFSHSPSASEPALGEGERLNAWFRLPIDRSFVVQGHGTVVTGSVQSGSVKVGDEVEWLPSGRAVRVRSLQTHDQPVDEVHRGMRAAVNLAGVDHKDVVRGQEIATPGYLKPSRVVTVRLHCLREMKRPIKHRLPVRFHVGTSEIMGTVSLLDCDTVDPGGWGLAQLFLDDPATTTWGQPFVIRGSSATLTIGGGQVLQPVAKKIRRRHLETLERVEKLWTGDAKERALAVAWFGGFAGFTQADLVRGANLAPDQATHVIQQLRDEHRLVTVTFHGGRQAILHADVISELDERILTALGKMHEESPLMTSHDRKKVQAQLDYIGDDALVHAEVDRLIKMKKIVGDLRRVARADFKPKLSASLRKLKDKVVEAYHTAGFQPPDPASFATQAGGNAASLKDLFDVCVAEGFLVHIDGDVFLHNEIEAEMRRRVTERLTSGPGATVAEIRDLLGTTRKYAIPYCEYIDRIGLTKRDGDLRVLARTTMEEPRTQ
ncbi:MAG: selenocysteine-specific translation elongation factor [Planctomycetes bacterium]|nr:selenocysteine-specific translation elongation factor [Planctomycetota bacterium]